jgi:uncharacterized protein YndB with AHSA1/START domain
MDVRPGGHWRHVMRTPDGAEHHLHFVFEEVVEPERLSWRAEAGVVGEPSAFNILTLGDFGKQTRVTFVSWFPSIADRELALSWCFDRVLREGAERMDQLLATLL